MAADKKSFILYSDLIHTVNKMPNEKAGELFKHILSYVNDEEPVSEDLIIQLTFEPIKQQLKRDLKKYKEIKSKRSDAGKESARLRALKKEQQNKQKSTSVESVQQTPTNPTVNDNVNVNVNGINKIIYSESDFLENWKMCRKSFLKKPTHIAKLESYERVNFDKAKINFTKEEINKAMLGLFNQENKNIASMFLKPKHFLENVSKYLNAELSKEYHLYGKSDDKQSKKGGL